MVIEFLKIEKIKT